MLLLIDNYDSFVYNIVHWINYPEEKILVRRNDEIRVREIEDNPDIRAVILSPGPMGPNEAGVSNAVIHKLGSRGVPTLGICLGHQCIGHVYGCRVERHAMPTHGKQSAVQLKPSPLFDGLGDSITVGRYHSLHVSADEFNHDELEITATLDDGTVMALQHKRYPIYGVQFHPESVLTGAPGRAILNNFVKAAGLH